MDLKVYALLNAKIKELTGSGGLTQEEVEKIVTDEVAKIVADAPEDFDTLKEMSDWISTHENGAAEMNSAIQTNANDISALNTNKVDKVEGKSLISDIEIERLANVDNYNDSSIRADIETNETNISTLAKHINGDLLDSDFQEDTTAVMTKTVPSGMSDYAAVKMIGGKTQKFNQLALTEGHRTFPHSVNNITMSENNGNISIIANNSTAVTYIQLSGITSVIGHVYYVKNGNGYTSGTNIFVYNDYGGISTQNCSKMIGIANKEKSFYIRIDAGVTANVTIRPQIFDLTAMFGAGNEPTMEEFDAKFPEEYYAPTMGELWNAPVESVVSVSKNLFSVPLIPKSYINVSSGAYGTSVNWSATYDFINISPNTTYTISNITIDGTLAGTAFYDENKNYISGTKLYTFTTPSNAKYMRTCTNSETDIYNVQLEKGSVATEYSPYNKTMLPIPEAIKNLPDYGVEGNVVDFENGTYTHTNTTTDGEVTALSISEIINISDMLMPIRVVTGGTITFNNEHNLDMPNTVVYKKEVSLS